MTTDRFSRRFAIKLIQACIVAAVVFSSASARPISFSRASNYDISYVIRVDRADLSGFAVQMRIPRARGTTRLAMAFHPIYDDRYWRYIEDLSAESRGAKLSVTHEESALWRVEAPGGELIVKYRIRLPPETSPIRSVWKPFLSETGGLVGDLHSFMYVVGATSNRARVTLDIPKDWAIASGLDPTSDPKTFAASSVELLLDSPIAIGKFQQWDFIVNGVPHRVVYLPQANAAAFDTSAFVGGLKRLASEAIKIFGRPPYGRYTFIYQDGADGALEHLNSVTIGARSQSIAQGLGGVFQTTAHEYFHTWNLMRVRPVERVGIRFRPVDPASVLWWSEGVTIYFSDLLLRRAKLPTSEPTRLAHLENRLATYLFTPGYSHISPERVSLTSEDPFALGDDFSSVHLQGEVLGSMLDLMVREATHGQRSLDDVMRLLSERFTPRRGIGGRDIERAVHDTCGCDAHTFFEAHVRGTQPLGFDRYLRAIGLRMHVSWAPAVNNDGTPAADLRIFALARPEGSAPRLRLTNPASAWGRAGLHTGDRLISVDGQRVATPADFRVWLGKLHIGDTTRVEVGRNGRTLTISIAVSGYDRPTVRLEEIPETRPEQVRLRTQWLNAE